MLLGDARSGKLADNVSGFGRALRRAGLRVDSARMALAQQAMAVVGVEARGDLGAALEAVFVNREPDRAVFRELFDAWFRDPQVAHKLLAQMLPSAASAAQARPRRPRVSEALAPQKAHGGQDRPKDEAVQLDAAMSASGRERLKHADFNGLSASEYHLVESLARGIRLPVPQLPMRRSQPAGARGARVHWPRTLRQAARHGGELMVLRRLQRVRAPLPLLVLVDVSGSMERYARLLLAFLHAATRGQGRRDVFAFGTHLTDLTPAFRLGDTDAMLAAASAAIDDFAGGTRLGDSLASLRRHHARRLVGRRTLVLVVTDGLDTGEPQDLARELDWLTHRSRRLLWLNPLLRFDGYQPIARGAATLHRHVHGMLAVHNLSKLEDLAASLAAVMNR